MRLYLHDAPFSHGPCVAALGMFDGVHTGHKQVLERAREIAWVKKLPLAVISFENHPLSVLEPQKTPQLLTTNSEKASLLHDQDVQALVLLRFNEQLSQMQPEEYLAYLKQKYAVQCLVVGENHRFGAGGAGNAQNIAALAQSLGIEAVIVPVKDGDGETVSSTLIRQALKAGNVEQAREMLGYSYTLSGPVVHGQGIGHNFGFPTINVSVPENKLLPRYGVYGVFVRLGRGLYRGVCNVGVRPTLGGEKPSVEAFLLDFDNDVYGDHARVRLIRFFRPEMRFSSMEELSRQVQRDIRRMERELPLPF